MTNRNERTRLRLEAEHTNRLKNHPMVPYDFDWQMYLELNPLLVKKGLNNEALVLRHYIKVGHRSGLPYKTEGTTHTPTVKTPSSPAQNNHNHNHIHKTVNHDIPGLPSGKLKNASKFDRWAPHVDLSVDYQKTFDILMNMIERKQGFTYARICDGEYKILFWKTSTWEKINNEYIKRSSDAFQYFLDEKLNDISNGIEDSPLLLGMQTGSVYDEPFIKDLIPYRPIIDIGITSVFPSWAYVTDNLPKLFNEFTKSGNPIIVVGPEYLSSINEFQIYKHVKTPLDYSWLDQDEIEYKLRSVIENLVERKNVMPIILYACAITGKMAMADLYKKYRGRIIQLDMGSNLDPYANVISRGWHDYEKKDHPSRKMIHFTCEGDRTGARIHEDIMIWAWCEKTGNVFSAIKPHSAESAVDAFQKKSRFELHKDFIDLFGIPARLTPNFKPSHLDLGDRNLWHEITTEHLEYRDRVDELYTPEFRRKALDIYYGNPINSSIRPSDRLVVSVHIRRGDVNENMPTRYVPNSYFVNLIQKIQSVEPLAEINIFSDTSYENSNGGNANSKESLDIFKEMGCNLYINLDIDKTWRMMTDCDILISSRSSFSWVPGFYNKNLVIHYDSWIQKMGYWLSNNDPELFEKIEYYINNRHTQIGDLSENKDFWEKSKNQEIVEETMQTHNSKENIVLFGGGNQAHYTIDIIEKENKYNIVGIIDSVHEVGSDRFGYPVLGRQENLVDLINQYNIQGGVISIGDNWSRYYVSQQILQIVPSFKFVNAIHPSVVIGNTTELGIGVVAMAGCIFNPKAKIGNFTFFATGAQVEHDNVIHDYASISAGSITGGYVTLGKFSAITLGVTVVDRVEIGENTVIGAGSLVMKSLPDNVLAYGNPAVIVRERQQGEKFLK